MTGFNYSKLMENGFLHTSLMVNITLLFLQFVCGAVSVIVNGKQPSIKPNAFFVSSRNLPKTNQFHCFEFTEFSDMVFALSSLWDLDVDGVRTHWVANLYATGLDDKGKEVRHCITVNVYFNPHLVI